MTKVLFLVAIACMVLHEILTGTLSKIAGIPVERLHRSTELRRHPRLGKWLIVIALGCFVIGDILYFV